MSATTLSLANELADTVARVRAAPPGPVFAAIAHSVADLRETGLVFTVPETLRRLHQGISIDLPDQNGDATFSLPVRPLM